MQEPKAPYWDPNLPRWAIQDIDRYIRNGIQSYPDVLRAVNSVGGIDAYRNMAVNYEKAHALYEIDFYKWDLERAKANNSTAVSGNESRVARAYEKAAKLGLFSADESKNFSNLANQFAKQSEATAVVEARNYELGKVADKTRDELYKQIWPSRDAEYERLSAERKTQREQLQAAYDYDRQQALELYKAKMMSPADYKAVSAMLGDNYTAASNKLTEEFKAAYGAVGQTATKQLEFVDKLVADIKAGNYDPEQTYTLPSFDYKPVNLSVSYTPLYQKPKEEEKQPDQPGSAPPIQPPPINPTDPTQPPAEKPPAEKPPAEKPPAEQPPGQQPPGQQPPAEKPPAELPPAQKPPTKITAPKSPNVVRAPQRTASDLVGRARVVDQTEQGTATQKLEPAAAAFEPPKPAGLIGGAGLLSYTPSVNTPANRVGLLMNQNPQLYNLNMAGVRLPGQGV
jgi:hypothetical protein